MEEAISKKLFIEPTSEKINEWSKEIKQNLKGAKDFQISFFYKL